MNSLPSEAKGNSAYSREITTTQWLIKSVQEPMIAREISWHNFFLFFFIFFYFFLWQVQILMRDFSKSLPLALNICPCSKTHQFNFVIQMLWFL